MLRITDDKGTLVPNAAIKGFTLSESINSMFVIARLDIEDTNSVVSNGLSIGQRYKVSMEDEESSLTQDMRVLKFSKTPVEGEYSTSTVTITLISDWYFTSFKIEKAYHGTPSEVISQVLASKKIDYDTSDTRSLYFYRCNDQAPAFLKRVSAYATRECYPMYLYTDVEGKIHFKGINTFYTSSEEVLVSPISLADASSKTSKSSQSGYKSKVYPLEYALNSDSSRSNSVTSFYFNYEHFTEVAFTSPISIGNAEINNTSSNTYTPENNIYLDWSFTPDIALAGAIKAAFERNMDTFFATCAFGNLAKDLKLGRKAYLYLPDRTSANSEDELLKGSGHYIVFGRAYRYDLSTGTFTTIVTMIDANI